MADGRIDPFDVVALERSVNDSAGRVSGIWLSFVAFSAYLAAAVSMISHRQIFLEDPIKLPTINIDLPLLASAILLPLLFVLYHIFVLLQVVLLARTADTYNEAINHCVTDAADRIRVRQRLANTLFAQLFAGSSREREGVLGWLLRAMAWITLAIAPVGVLIVFEIKFLPYHRLSVTWIHRLLIGLDLAAVFLLWAGAVDPRRDISARSLIVRPRTALAALVLVGLWWSLVTIPGEPTRSLMRNMSSVIFTDQFTDSVHPDCWAPGLVAALFSDSLVLQGEDFVDDATLAKIVATARANAMPPHKSDRTRVLRGRDLRCGHLAGVDLRRADFSGADLTGISLKGAHLDGTVFSGARLEQAKLDSAQLQDAYFAGEEDDHVKNADELLQPAGLVGASLQGAQLQGVLFRNVRLQGASLEKAQLQGADFDEAQLQGASLNGAQLDGATLQRANMQAVQMVSARAIGASFADAGLQGASLGSVDFEGSNFQRTLLQGVRFDNGRLSLSDFSSSALWRATRARCADAVVSTPDFGAFIGFESVGQSRGRPAELAPIKPEPDAIDKFIEQSGRSVPESAANQLRARLKQRLSPRDPDPDAQESEKTWSGCAEKSIPSVELQAQRVNLFATFSCEPTANSRYVAEGIARLRWSLLDAAGARMLARRLLELDGKPCPGAKDLGESIRAELRETAGE